MFEFRLEGHSRVPAYIQLVQQVKHALRLGVLKRGDQLPTVKEVVDKLRLSPNTVLKAYRELEREGLVVSRPGQGTFVQRALHTSPLASHSALRASLESWLQSAREAGLDDDSILALFNFTFHQRDTVESESKA